MNESRLRFAPSAERAWRAFDRISGRPWRVTPAAPILFFGDLDAYLSSTLRILTVGKNPSWQEFPACDPFRRFPLLSGDSRDRDPDRYLDAMSAYFCTDPYSSWFAGFEPLLNGVGSSYYADTAASTALHTDICSPIATDPTWTKLGPKNRAALAADGVPLWHVLLKALRPQIVILSMAKEHLGHIKFTWASHWETLVVFERTEDDGPRGRYQVKARWYEVDGELSLFVFGRATQKPFGSVSNNQKRHTGAIAMERYSDGP